MSDRYAYLDTSSWLKLFVPEEGSDIARRLADSCRLFSSAILLTEAYSALRHKCHAGSLDEKSLQELATSMQDNVKALGIINVGTEVLAKAQEIVLAHPIRSLDSIHVASAIVVQSLAGISFTFITGDRRQLEVARSLGLETVLT